jgi:thioesterase domain-containing protein
VFCYQALVARLANDRPCYGLEANGIENDNVLADTFEGIAREYAQALIEQNGPGRFHLMGWSLGGILSLELARMLVAAGNEVGSIILVDSYMPSTRATPEGDFARSVHLFAYQLQIDARAHDLRALGSEAAALARVLELGHRGGRIPVHLGLDHLTRRYRVYSTLDRAATRYAMPTTVPGRAVFVRATEGIQENGRITYSSDEWPASLWQTFDTRVLPGSHGSIVEVPYVDALARLIDEVIG